MMKGQSSVEFLLLVATFLVVLATFTVPQMVNPVRSASQNLQAASQTKTACDEIANAINGVSSSRENSTDSLGASIPDNWSLKMESNPPTLKLGVQTGGEAVWTKSSLKYGYDQEVSDISAGSYIVIVEKGGTETITQTENKIYVRVNPSAGGGKWRY